MPCNGATVQGPAFKSWLVGLVVRRERGGGLLVLDTVRWGGVAQREPPTRTSANAHRDLAEATFTVLRYHWGGTTRADGARPYYLDSST